jgi:glycosyltransferase involved in cell wall biosynthesis
MNVLYFTKYSRKGASSRLRSYQYFPALAKNGINVTVSPLFSDKYLSQLYAGKGVAKSLVFKCYLHRIAQLFKIGRYQKVIIEKELFPYFPAWIEWGLNKLGVKYIVDYDDAIFHNYDRSSNALIRKMLAHKIDGVMRYSHYVIAGNNYLAARATVAGARQISIIPTVIDLERYKPRPTSKTDVIIVGWIGSPSTTKYLEQLHAVLTKLARNHSIEFHVIGGKPLTWGKWVKNIPWSELTEEENIQKFDIGIMPLEDTPWEQGKCAYKLIQYMACGVPVVATPVGMNKDVVLDGTNGYLAENSEDWDVSITKYIEDFEMRQSHGEAGRRLVEDKYCIQKVWPTLVQIIRS